MNQSYGSCEQCPYVASTKTKLQELHTATERITNSAFRDNLGDLLAAASELPESDHETKKELEQRFRQAAARQRENEDKVNDEARTYMNALTNECEGPLILEGKNKLGQVVTALICSSPERSEQAGEEITIVRRTSRKKTMEF